MSLNVNNSLTSKLCRVQDELNEDVDNSYNSITQIIVEKEGELKKDLLLKKVSNKNFKDLTKTLDEIKSENKKSDELYVEHARLLKETQMLEKSLGIHITTVTEEDPYNVEIRITFKERENYVKLSFDVKYGAFALKEMNPQHKNFESIKQFLKQTQDVQGFIVNVQKYFKNREANQKNEAMEVDQAT